MNLTDDAQIKEILGFLRRGSIHYQRFGEALMDVQDNTKADFCKL